MDFTGKTAIVTGGARGLAQVKAGSAEEVAAQWHRIKQPPVQAAAIP
ncbi:hypothetical protein K2E96_22085 [Pseudomonas sp. ERGC3:05]|nr:hypothetical protein [Pseudomonas sp. ERGC3:01]QZC97342.1 hypothetical protein K2E96_22085 [Pseudomonas sp. ERGC3:05]